MMVEPDGWTESATMLRTIAITERIVAPIASRRSGPGRPLVGDLRDATDGELSGEMSGERMSPLSQGGKKVYRPTGQVVRPDVYLMAAIASEIVASFFECHGVVQMGRVLRNWRESGALAPVKLSVR